MFKKAQLIFVFSLFLSNFSFAQKQKDATFWPGINVEKKINKRFSAICFSQLALNQNYAEIGSVFLDLGLSYKINNYISVSGNYRFVKLRNLDNYYNDVQRLYADLTFSKGYKKFYFQFRSRIQEQNYGIDFFDHSRPNKYFSRNKITAYYRFNRTYSLSLSGEQFYRLNKRNKTEAIRLGIDFAYKFNLKNRIDIFYMNQFQKNIKNPRIDFITGITYGYKF